MSAAPAVPVAACFNGTYHFPGPYAFFQTASCPVPALLQVDEPYTGQFDDSKAQYTCGVLQAIFHEGEQRIVTGLIGNCDVNGIFRPVLFLFKRPIGAPPCPNF